MGENHSGGEKTRHHRHPPEQRPVFYQMHEFFRRFSVQVSRAVGSIWAFLTAVSLILLTGIYYNFSAAWENDVSFVATLTALLVLFFLQKSQNHGDKATHLKLDELIKAVEGARNEVAAVENQEENQIDKLKEGIESHN